MRHLEPHDVAEPAPAQLDLHRLEQVVGVVGHVEVGVARDPERRRLDHLHAREEPRQEVGDHLLEREHHLVAAHGDVAGHALRHLHPRQPLLAGGRIAHEHAQAEREAGDVRERLAGADRKRRQHRVDLALVVGAERPQLGPRGLLDAADLDAGLGQPGQRARARRASDCFRTCSRTLVAISSSVVCGLRPSGERTSRPEAAWRSRPATRTMKNSSRPTEMNEHSRMRWSSGTLASWPSWMQRSFQSSQDSSRFRNRSGGGGLARRAAAPPRRRRAVWISATPAAASPLSAPFATRYPNRPVTYASVRSSDGRVNSCTVGACSTRTPQRAPDSATSTLKKAVMSATRAACCMLWVTITIV